MNEEGVGAALRKLPNKPFLTTKLWPGKYWFREDQTIDHKATLAATEESLKKLGVDCIDLYLIHAPLAGKEGRL